MTIAREQITGVILAGGLGRRMSTDGQGVDKGLQPFRGRPMVAHAIERLAPQVGPLLINANQNLDTYRALGPPVVSDSLPGFAGPLAGLASAMAAARTEWLVSVPCDSPLLPTDLVSRLAAAASANSSQVSVVHTRGQPQPVFLLVRCSLLENLRGFLASGQRKIDAWYSALQPAVAEFDDEQAFRNINTREELRSLE